jgi:chorismate mutase
MMNLGINGLAELRKVVREMDRELPKDLTRRLKEASEVVAEEARRTAPERSGRLRRSIKAFARGNLAGVSASAVDRRTGYRYPKRLEYERAPRGRPFLEPALDRRKEEVERRVAQVLDDLADDWADRGVT